MIRIGEIGSNVGSFTKKIDQNNVVSIIVKTLKENLPLTYHISNAKSILTESSTSRHLISNIISNVFML